MIDVFDVNLIINSIQSFIAVFLFGFATNLISFNFDCVTFFFLHLNYNFFKLFFFRL